MQDRKHHWFFGWFYDRDGNYDGKRAFGAFALLVLVGGPVLMAANFLLGSRLSMADVPAWAAIPGIVAANLAFWLCAPFVLARLLQARLAKDSCVHE